MKTFRCDATDAHFVSVYLHENQVCVMIEDYWRDQSLLDRIKTAFRILFRGIGEYSEIVLNKQETIDLGVYLFECANRINTLSKDGQVVHNVPQDATDLFLLGIS